MDTTTNLRQRSYQVYGGMPLALALERYRQRFHRAPGLIVAHPRQAAVVAGVVAAAWCQCAATPGLGAWYLWPSRKDMEAQ